MFRLVQHWCFKQGSKRSRRFKSIPQSSIEHLWMPVTGLGLRGKIITIIITFIVREAPSSASLCPYQRQLFDL